MSEENRDPQPLLPRYVTNIAFLLSGVALAAFFDVFSRIGVTANSAILFLATAALSALLISVYLRFRLIKARESLQLPELPENLSSLFSRTYWDNADVNPQGLFSFLKTWAGSLSAVFFLTLLVGELALLANIAVGYLQANRLQTQNQLIRQQSVIEAYSVEAQQQNLRVVSAIEYVNSAFRTPDNSSDMNEALLSLPELMLIPVPSISASSTDSNTSDIHGSETSSDYESSLTTENPIQITYRYPSIVPIRTSFRELLRRPRFKFGNYEEISFTDLIAEYRLFEDQYITLLRDSLRHSDSANYPDFIATLWTLSLPLEQQSWDKATFYDGADPAILNIQSSSAKLTSDKFIHVTTRGEDLEWFNHDSSSFSPNTSFVGLQNMPPGFLSGASLPFLDVKNTQFPGSMDLSFTVMPISDLTSNTARYLQANSLFAPLLTVEDSNLDFSKFEDSILDGLSVLSSTFNHAHFNNTSLMHSGFYGVSLVGSVFRNIQEQHISFNFVSLHNSYFTDSSFINDGERILLEDDEELNRISREVSWTELESYFTYARPKIESTKFISSGFNFVSFDSVDFVDVDFSYSRFSNTRISNSNIEKANFGSANLDGLRFVDTTLTESSFSRITSYNIYGISELDKPALLELREYLYREHNIYFDPINIKFGIRNDLVRTVESIPFDDTILPIASKLGLQPKEIKHRTTFIRGSLGGVTFDNVKMDRSTHQSLVDEVKTQIDDYPQQAKILGRLLDHIESDVTVLK